MSHGPELLIALPSDRRGRLVQALQMGLIRAPYTQVSIQRVIGVANGSAEVVQALAALHGMGLDGPACAAWIKTLDDVASKTQRPDLVWSGPEIDGIHARDTRVVYEELMKEAKQRIWISTYAYYDAPKQFDVLAKRMDEVPDLHTTLLMNIERKWGDTSTADALVHGFAEKLWGKHGWPGERRPAVFYDPRALEPETADRAVLHAKAVVVDDSSVFITSANLTEKAWDKNYELGLLTRDRTLALSIAKHFQLLIDNKLLSRLPES